MTLRWRAATFLELSRALLGDDQLAAEHAATLLALLLPATVDPVLTLFDGRPASAPVERWIAEHLWRPELAGGAHRAACQTIINAWLFGPREGMQKVDVADASRAETRRAEAWYRGRFWKYVQAHAPGVSGGYFGHWSYPPDAELRPTRPESRGDDGEGKS